MMMVPRIRRTTRIANLAPTVLPLGDPLPHWIAASVVSNDLVNRKNRPPAGRVTDDAARAMIAIIRLRG